MLYFHIWHFERKALHKDCHTLRTRGSKEPHQVLKDEREALVSVDDVM